MRRDGDAPSAWDTAADANVNSALIHACQATAMIRSSSHLYKFLGWQAAQKGSTAKQGKFKEDALNFPGLLVFSVMCLKSLYITLK